MLIAVLAAVAGFVASLHAPALADTPAPAGAIVESPTQVAFLQAAVKKAQRHFAREAASISGISFEKALHLLPNASDWRSGDPRFAVVPALEKARRAPLSDEQREKINGADRAMKEAIARARLEAARH